MKRLRLATCSLAGCFGCHMSLLDMDQTLFELSRWIALDRSPLTDQKICGACDIGLIEGGLCNRENVEVLLNFRRQCRILVAVGACAINGGVPAMRNGIPLGDCLNTAYGPEGDADSPELPRDPELPQLLDRVRPVQEAVLIDYFLPGCPPPAQAFERLLRALHRGESPQLDYPLRRFD